jgi:DNA-directed RNA polymerase subunit RPC12/RpoP
MSGCARCGRRTGSGRRLCSQCELDERYEDGIETRGSSDDQILACPYCDSTRVRERLPPDHPRAVEAGREGDHEAPYYCDDCQQAVVAPVERPPRADRSVHGLAKTLVETDPETVERKSGGDRP